MDDQIACPKCTGVMTSRAVGDVVIDQCAACGGLWLDALEKDKLLQDSAAAREADSAAVNASRELDVVRHINCPRDGSQMIRLIEHGQPHIHFESCTVCGGMFLDPGELRDISELTLRERLKRFAR